MTPEPLWPANRSLFDDLPSWLASALPGRPEIRGPIRVLRMHRWGGTAVFEADGRPVVVQHTQPPLYPAAAAVHAVVSRVCPHQAAPLLAHDNTPDWQRSVFGFVAGPTAREAGPHTLVPLAAALGQAQAALAATDLFGLPGYAIEAVPDDLADDLAATGDQDPALRNRFLAALPVLRHHAELLAEALPVSLDHPGLSDTKAIVTEDSIVLLDWAEATVGCPLFSLPRLLAAATDERTRADMIDAYLAALFGARSPGTRRLLDLAMIVAPLQQAVEARRIARTLHLRHPHTDRTARHLAESLHRLSTVDRPRTARPA